MPAGLDWDMWQMDWAGSRAPKKAFKPSRLGFPRVVRVRQRHGRRLGRASRRRRPLVHERRRASSRSGRRPSESFIAVPDADPERSRTTFSISWQYDNFIVTFANGEVATAGRTAIENWGVFFIGNRGSLQVNRQGYAVRPSVAARDPQAGPAAAADGGRSSTLRRAAGRRRLRAGRRAPGGAAEAADGGGRWWPRWSAAAAPRRRPDRAQDLHQPEGGVEEDYPLDVHTQNFLDCVKSRARSPTRHGNRL